jgi:hypothetical protein
MRTLTERLVKNWRTHLNEAMTTSGTEAKYLMPMTRSERIGPEYGLLVVDPEDIEDDAVGRIGLGKMVAEIMERAPDQLESIFEDGADVEKELADLNKTIDKGMAGPIPKWDGHLFNEFYSMDGNKIMALYAQMEGLEVVEDTSKKAAEQIHAALDNFKKQFGEGRLDKFYKILKAYLDELEDEADIDPYDY